MHPHVTQWAKDTNLEFRPKSSIIVIRPTSYTSYTSDSLHFKALSIQSTWRILLSDAHTYPRLNHAPKSPDDSILRDLDLIISMRKINRTSTEEIVHKSNRWLVAALWKESWLTPAESLLGIHPPQHVECNGLQTSPLASQAIADDASPTTSNAESATALNLKNIVNG